jgi:3'(2'), 5'-bisphosphate nucleotidase
MTNYFEYIQPLTKIVLEAAEKIMSIYNAGTYEVQVKSDDSPVTMADIAANDIICAGLKEISDFPFISEENMQIDYNDRKDYKTYWLIDPLDGTKEFVKRNGEFTINVALIENNIPVVGVVQAPALNELYYAAKGHGAFLEKNGKTCRLSCSSFDAKDKNLRIPSSLSFINNDTKNFITQYDEPIVIGRGSALKFMMIANAEADLYPRLAPTMEWDTAAPQIIIEEAGGTLIDLAINSSMVYNKPSLVNNGFVAFSIKK